MIPTVFPRPWKVFINPFGESSDQIDNIMIHDNTGSGVLIITKHPVWRHMEIERFNLAQAITKLINSQEP